jgi:hypothetical protein
MIAQQQINAWRGQAGAVRAQVYHALRRAVQIKVCG